MKKILLAAALLLSINCASAQHTALRQQINQIANEAKGKVGVAISILEDNDTLTYQNNRRYVMHSIMKFPIAMAVLHEIDKGRLKLQQKIHITKADLPKTYSPIRDKYPNGVDMPVSELLSYMVSLSDNNACDILLKQLGGTAVVEKYIHSLSIKPFSLKASEAQMASAWRVQYTNWCYPYQMVRLLNIMYTGTALKKETNNYLWKIMLETSTGPGRLKGLLPAGTQVAHKTGTSPTNNKNLSPATNDVGIIILPNGKHMAIAVLVCDSYANDKTRDMVIAQITKAAWDEFTKK